MDGKQLTRVMLDFLDEETADALFAKERLLYTYLDAAASRFARETLSLKSTATITTVADQQTYDLPPDFIGVYMKNSRGRYFAKYYDGANYSWPLKSTYEKIFKGNLTTAKSSPSRFCFVDSEHPTWDWYRLATEAGDDLVTEAGDYIVLEQLNRGLVTGTAGSDGLISNGDCTLYDSGKTFTSTVFPRDTVHNLDDQSTGIVIKTVDTTHLVTALFGGSTNQWTEDDNYTIIPTVTKRIMLDAPSESSGHTITIPYICMPAPMFSDHCYWRFPPQTCMAIAQEAAFMYENQKADYNSANRHHELFEMEIIKFKRETANQILQSGRYRQRI